MVYMVEAVPAPFIHFRGHYMHPYFFYASLQNHDNVQLISISLGRFHRAFDQASQDARELSPKNEAISQFLTAKAIALRETTCLP